MTNAGRAAEVLLIEDSSQDIMLTKKAFAAAPFTSNLSVAKSAAEALAFLQREGDHAAVAVPDLILLDLNLPDESGMELLKKIKADPRLNPIPVIVLTGSLSEMDIVKSYNLQAHSYIVKPVDLKTQQIIPELLQLRKKG